MWTVAINDAELEAAGAEAQRVLEAGVSQAVEAAVRDGAEEAVERHPYQNRTGKLEASTTGKMTGPTTGVIEATEDYASYVNRKPRFNFMQRAAERAQETLDRRTEAAAERAADVLRRR